MSKRKLTSDEVERVFLSANLRKERNKDFDFNQDSSLRYILNGFEYWAVVNKESIFKIEIPADSHVCNIIGNMNYTQSYKNQSENL